MSQKFIFTPERTTKKTTFFPEEKSKRFSRKRSERDQSHESRRSRQNSINNHYIKNLVDPAYASINLTHDQTFLFAQQPVKAPLQGPQTDRRPRKSALTRTNGTHRQSTREQCTLTLKIKILETQIKAKQSECQRFKLLSEQQRERRRKAEYQKKSSLKEIAAIQKQNEELLTQTKKLNKQKQILSKQIQFLQKINYDEKTRDIQSFREKHMQEEILLLREKLGQQRPQTEITHQAELQIFQNQKEVSDEKFRSMQSLVAVLKRKNSDLKAQIIQERLITKERIIRSQQYRQLRDRYKRFIDQYKDLKNQNSSLKKLCEDKQAQLILSEEEDKL